MSAKYIRLANLLRSSIYENSNDSYKLPTEKELCTRFGVSRQTVRKALSVLAEENLIQKRQGSGSYATIQTSSYAGSTIAMLIHSDSEYAYPSLIADMKSRLQAQNYALSVYITDNSVSKEREILQQLLTLPVRGVISQPCKSCFPTPNKDLYLKLHQRDVSLLFFNENYSNLMEFPSLQWDNYAGGYFLGQYLANHHHTKVAGIFQSDSGLSIERYHGYLSALVERNLPIDDDVICWYTTSQLSLLREKKDTGFLTRFIQKNCTFCTAVLCDTDEIAYWLAKELKYMGKSIPDDISVVCFHNTYLNELNDTHITTMTEKPHEVAQGAVEQILQLIGGHSVSSQKLPFHLVERGSVQSPMIYLS